MVWARILGFVVIRYEVVREVLSSGHIGDSKDFRTGDSRVVVF